MKAFIALSIVFLLHSQTIWAQEGINFLVFGDSGTGEEDQFRVGTAMENACAERGCGFAIMLGDNVYERGVAGAQDDQFLTKFELPYQGLHFKFYAALGNHDMMAGENAADSEVRYSKLSDRWVMKARYYSYAIEDSEFFAIDSNTFGDRDPKQVEWLRTELKKSKAHWKFVYGHHPMYSVGDHKFWDIIEGFKLEKLQTALEPILCENKVDAYFSGHEHFMELDLGKCGIVHAISGASAKTRKTHKTLVKQHKKTLLFSQGNTLGFAHVNLLNDNLHIAFIDVDGNELLAKDFPKRDAVK